MLSKVYGNIKIPVEERADRHISQPTPEKTGWEGCSHQSPSVAQKQEHVPPPPGTHPPLRNDPLLHISPTFKY